MTTIFQHQYPTFGYAQKNHSFYSCTAPGSAILIHRYKQINGVLRV